MLWIENLYNQILFLAPYFATTLTLLLALLLDNVLGEAKKYHYLVGFGWLATKIESALNSDKCRHNKTHLKTQILGTFSWCLLVLPLPIIYFLCLNNLIWYWQILLDASVLYLAVGLNSLHQHAMQIYTPLKSGDLDKARHFTAYIVSRETNQLSPQEMSRATVESMLENGHDSVIASMVYYIIGGAPLVILHRFTNTLDAMWGYKNTRFNYFGYASAKLDDLLGFISGKICTLLYAIQGNFKESVINAYQQGNQYKSHNGGWVMAAGATVMKLTLGGTALYHGKTVTSPILGISSNKKSASEKNSITVEDIPRSITLVKRAATLLLWLVFIYELASYLLYN
jgi:adenosylcobinamide-phosphate synthase